MGKSRSLNIFVHVDAENVFEFSEVTFPSVPLKRIEHQFHATGDAQLVENANQIIPHGVCGQVRSRWAVCAVRQHRIEASRA